MTKKQQKKEKIDHKIFGGYIWKYKKTKDEKSK